jgi:hypothetical protein
MKVYVLKYDTVYEYGDGTKYTGVDGVYSSRERAEQEIVRRKQTGAYNDTYYEVEEFEVE